ncbi:MAG: pyridoxal phosphate-dependent aminotransferase family protein [Gelidibacter sp.]|uniref:aminotransferase class I/II-fold pyridoxal phosphate-dependent enzyme n=1 Tax=Gelidibacter sp. TaxID=2018083 RepID=UPI00326764ED
MIPKKLQDQLDARNAEITFRALDMPQLLVDFASNDYLGFSMSNEIFDRTHYYLENEFIFQNGSKGSWLLSGNHQLYAEVEELICETYHCNAALIFNSGYNANLGFFSCVPQHDDIIFYDELIHASIRDGIAMGEAKAFAFKHNDLEDLKRICQNEQPHFTENTEVYIATESVFSIDGDTPDLVAIADFCELNKFRLIVDEAHAIGVFGKEGEGLVRSLGIDKSVFARLISFGKALSSHGAAILGDQGLIDYLIQFSSPSSYTTAIAPHSLMTIKASYKELELTHAIKKLNQNIRFFKEKLKENQLEKYFTESNSAIQCCTISDSEKVKKIVRHLNEKGFDPEPIFSPTVPKGQERIRFCIHAYNSEDEISKVLSLLAPFFS